MDEIAILDFGGQYAHLICNRIRRLGVHAVIMPPTTPASELKAMKGLILSGGPQSVNAKDALTADPKIFELGVPVLGICYGHQLTNKMLGGKVSPGKTKEYGKTTLYIDKPEGIFANLHQNLQALSRAKPRDTTYKLQPSLQVWMSHWDEVTEMPVDFEVLGHTEINEFAAVGNLTKNIYGIQFHAEVTHTEQGMKILENFVNLTGAKKTWNAKNYLEQIKKGILSSVISNAQSVSFRASPRVEESLGGGKGIPPLASEGSVGMTKRVFMLVSGGVDSLVAFTLLNKILGPENVYGLLVDTGFMRKGEIEEVSKALDKLGFHNLHVVNARKTFYKALENVTDPEEKRRIIGKTFVEIQAREIKKLHMNSSLRPNSYDLIPNSYNLTPTTWLLGQGTIYPDTIESGGTKHADKIKTHHNRVPEIQAMIDKGLVIEPLKDLYKDEVRELGEMLGLPHHLVWRHPFPGPGLAIRILCTPSVIPTESFVASGEEGRAEESLSINQFLKPHGLSGTILPIRSVGVQGDARTYRHPLAITPLNGKSWRDFWNHKKMEKLSTELTNRFGSINRVIFQLYSQIPNSKFQIPNSSFLTPQRIAFLQEADKIVMDEINTFDLEERSIWQCPTVLLPFYVSSRAEQKGLPEAGAVERSLDSALSRKPSASLGMTAMDAILLRPVSSIDAMTASFVLMPKKNLENILKNLSALGPSAIFYDLTNKPPGTIEWE